MRLQKKAIRIVTCSEWNDSAFPLFKNVLTICLLFQYETAKLVHRHSSNDLPVNLSNYLTLSKNIYSIRSTTNENLHMSLFRTGAKIWNSIPSNIRKSSFQNFKKCSKHIYFTHLLLFTDLFILPDLFIIYSTRFVTGDNYSLTRFNKSNS